MVDPEKILKVSAVTSDGIVYSHNVTMVAMRVIDGERTIMCNHLPIVAPLAISGVRVKRTHEMDDCADHTVVNGGYTEFLNSEATIIADSTGCARSIDVERAQSTKKRVKQHIQEAKEKRNEREMLEAEIALRRAVNRSYIRENYGR